MGVQPGAMDVGRAPTSEVDRENTRATAGHLDGGRGSRARYWREVGWRHVVGLLAVAFALFPVVWVLSASFNPSSTLAGQRVIPTDPTLENYRTLWNTGFPQWFVNSLIISGTAAAGTVLLCALGAYAFSRMRFTGRRVGLLTLLLVQMFPQLLAMVALYLMMIRIGDIFPAIGTGTRPASSSSTSAVRSG